MNTRIDHSLLAVAMDQPDDNIAPPSRKQSDSMVAQLVGLGVGDVCSKARPIDPSMSLAEYAATATKLREHVRSSANSSVRVAVGRHPDREFEIDVVEATSAKRQVYLVAIVTRTV